MLYALVLRSYAPFHRFGGIYRGDGRGPTTSPHATSRVKSWIVFDPSTGHVGLPNARSDASHFAFGPSWTATGMPVPRLSGVRRSAGWVSFQLHAAGSNPLFPGAPAIDVHVTVSASVTPRKLNMRASLTGDSFPNAEVMVQDYAGNRQMVLQFETTGSADAGPLRLMGDRRADMGGVSVSFDIDDQGLFPGSDSVCTTGTELR